MLNESSPKEITLNLGITNNFDVKYRIIKDAIQIVKMKQKLYYNIVRPVLPVNTRRGLQRVYNKKMFYKEDFIDDSIINQISKMDKPGSEYFPLQYKTAIVLTHDVETEKGLKYVPKLLEITRNHGFKSSWNIVPYKYKIDKGIIDLLIDAGEEIGIHGDNHDGKLFFSKKGFESRASAINRAIKEYGAKGFRTPMVHRNLVWLQELDIEYDCSCFDYDPFQPFPGGTGFIWPFRAGKFVELPYTIPQDHTLFYDLHQTSIKIWVHKIEWLIKNNGMILSVTHPDYLMNQKHIHMYIDLLEYLNSIKDAWRCLPSEMVKWWLSKYETEQFVPVDKYFNTY